MVLVDFWRTLVKIVVAFSTKDNETNRCHDLLTIWKNTDSDLKVHARTMQMSYLPFKNFCKLAKRAEKTRNYQKQVLVMIKHCLANSVFLQNFSLQNKHKIKFARETSRRADFIHSQREIKEILGPEKHTFSIKSEHKSTQKGPGSSSLPYSLPSLWKIGTRISQLSPFHHATWQHPRESVDQRGYMTSGWRNLF